MNSPQPQQPSNGLRYAAFVVVLLLAASAFYLFSVRLVAQAHYHRAENFFRKGYYGLAADELEKARKYNPDDFRIQRSSGAVLRRLAQAGNHSDKALSLAKSAKSHYFKAVQLNPLDAHLFFGLARTEALLQDLHRTINPTGQTEPYQPLPYFEGALRLRPNSTRYRYALARYLHREGNTKDLPGVVQALVRVYPEAYYDLRKEPFWSAEVEAACEKGLHEAIENHTSLREAYRALSSLKHEAGEWSGAIDHLRAALQERPFENKPGDYISLGRLYLKNGQPKEAQDIFLHALDRSSVKDKDLERIYWLYGKESRPEGFYEFCREAEKKFIFSHDMRLLLARSMIDTGRFNQARRMLETVNQQAADPKAFYLLARIAQKERDWDAMELSIQKATVLDPTNSRYHQLFARVLSRMNKLARAEEEAGLALSYADKPRPWLFDQRAWIRWKQGNYLGAARDWMRAARLDPDKPDKAVFYARAAEAYVKAGDLSAAMEHYKMASTLDPEDTGYREKYESLRNAG